LLSPPCLAGDIDVIGAGLFKREPNEFAAALDLGPVVELITHRKSLPSVFCLLKNPKPGASKRWPAQAGTGFSRFTVAITTHPQTLFARPPEDANFALMGEAAICLDRSSPGGLAMQLKAAVAACAMLFAVSGAQAGYVFKGNDTGGIISWNPEVAYSYKEIAAIHCWRYNKVASSRASIRSTVTMWDSCARFRAGYDPVKARYYQSLPVIRARGLTVNTADRPMTPAITFLIVLAIGIAAGLVFDRFAGPGWLTRQIAGSTRSVVTSALVGVAGAFVGFNIAVLLGLLGIAALIGAVVGAAVVLWAWRTIR